MEKSNLYYPVHNRQVGRCKRPMFKREIERDRERERKREKGRRAILLTSILHEREEKPIRQASLLKSLTSQHLALVASLATHHYRSRLATTPGRQSPLRPSLVSPSRLAQQLRRQAFYAQLMPHPSRLPPPSPDPHASHLRPLNLKLSPSHGPPLVTVSRPHLHNLHCFTDSPSSRYDQI
ncbi:hypothetical protein L1049_017420 [Liquidambar formosana]|uniref:Uncharacterized protein n=1 Tax=Liquidambar formosana TaxID=63359 RepID=A0AAP0S8H1_LIQFO